MASIRCFLPHFPSLFSGKPKASNSSRLGKALAHLHSQQLPDLAALLGPMLPDSFFASAPGGTATRVSIYTPTTVFWAFLFQILHPGMACQGVVAKIRAWLLCRPARRKAPSLGTAAFCQARCALGSELVEAAFSAVRDKLCAAASGTWLWCGHHVKVVDGSSVSMPDTPGNQQRWPQHPAQKPGCGFPTARLLGLFCLSTGAWLGHVLGKWCTHDLSLWHKLAHLLKRGDVLLGDAGFCSWALMAHLKAQGIDSVFRLHQARPKDLGIGRRVGRHESVQSWTKPPRRPKNGLWSQAVWDALPLRLDVRVLKVTIEQNGFRTQCVWIATTLTHVKTYTADHLAELYYRRWSIELFFRDVKSSLGMDVLRCKTAAMIEKEIFMHAIAYNSLRWLILHSAAEHGCELGWVSFKATVQILHQWLPQAGALADRPRLLEAWRSQLRAAIAEVQNPKRPGRREPRAVKRRPKTYQLLTKPRHQFTEIPHRENYRSKPHASP